MNARTSATGLRAAAVALSVLLGVLGLQARTPVVADPVTEFYSRTNVTFLVTTPPGGGNGLIATLLSRHLPKHIPGNPKVVLQFMPGAEGVRGTNYLYNVAPKDGSWICMPVASVPLAQYVVKEKGVLFDLPKFTWLGTVSRMTNVLTVWHAVPVRTLDDARRTEIVLASSGKLSWFYLEPKLMNALLGTRFKLVTGYPGSNEMTIALENGEVQARDQHWQSLIGERPDLVRDRKVVPIIQVGLAAVPALSGVPQFMDLVKSPEDKQMVKLMLATPTLGRSLMAPPGIPADRAAALRKAVAAMIADPEFVADMAAKNQDITPATATELQAFLEEVGATPPHVIEKVRKLLELDAG